MELYEETGIKLNIGVSAVIQNEFQIFNYENKPDLSIWLAVRMSCTIPFIFSPIVIDNDIYVDGGLLNNNPINYVISEILSSERFNIDEEEQEEKPENKYNFNFICINLSASKAKSYDSENISFKKYIELIFRKIFTNQSYKKEKYQDYIITIPCGHYEGISTITMKLKTKEEIEPLLEDVEKVFIEKFENKICC